MRRTLLLVAAGLLLAAAPGRAEEKAAPQTSIDSGMITGKWAGGVRAFLGIPYAAPPIGDLRWRPPAPVAPWRSPRECRVFGPVAPQPTLGRKARGLGTVQSEDCLTVNVWAPADPGEEKLPVMVWIHGGGMVIGSGSLPVYDGAAFARRGVILVTINYRLGPFGFFGHPWLSAESEKKVSGNYGILDQIAALEWVKRNAAAFGGDPDRVTIFGESAGAVSVCTLMVSPRAAGLFHRAIAQSGTAMGVTLPLRAEGGVSLEGRGVRLAARLGAEDLKALRALPTEAILETADPSPVTPDKQRKYGPVIDGWVLPDRPSALFAKGRQHDVPLMLGSNADDGSVFTTGNRIRGLFAYRFAAKTLFRADAARVLAAFPAKRNEDVPKAVRDVMTVSAFVAPARRVARRMEKVGSKAWLYHFRRVSPPAKRFGVGAAHGIEIPYVFGNLSKWQGVTETDFKLSRTMQDQWIRFAATGDPNGEGLPAWPAYDAKTDRHLDFGDEVKVGSGLLAEKCDLFDEIVAKREPPPPGKKAESKIDLPRCPTVGTVDGLGVPIARISMNKDGRITFRGKSETLDALGRHLSTFGERKLGEPATFGRPSDCAVVLRINRYLRWDRARALIAACEHADPRIYRIHLAVVPPGGGEEGVFAIYQSRSVGGIVKFGQGRHRPPLTVGARLELRSAGHALRSVTDLDRGLRQLPEAWKRRPVWLSPDSTVNVGEVVLVLDTLHRAGAGGAVFPLHPVPGSTTLQRSKWLMQVQGPEIQPVLNGQGVRDAGVKVPKSIPLRRVRGFDTAPDWTEVGPTVPPIVYGPRLPQLRFVVEERQWNVKIHRLDRGAPWGECYARLRIWTPGRDDAISFIPENGLREGQIVFLRASPGAKKRPRPKTTARVVAGSEATLQDVLQVVQKLVADGMDEFHYGKPSTGADLKKISVDGKQVSVPQWQPEGPVIRRTEFRVEFE